MNRMLHGIPFLRILIPLVIGIVVGYYIDFSISLFLFLFAFFLFAFSLFLKKELAFQYRWIFGVGAVCFFFALGICLMQNKKRQLNPEMECGTQVYQVEIQENPRERPTSIECLVKVALPGNEKVEALLYLFKDSLSAELRCGDILLIEAELFGKNSHLNPGEFDYEKYLHLKGIATSAYISDNKWKKISSRERFSIKNKSKQIQLKLMSIYKNHGIEDEEFAVLSALTLGNKEYLDPELRESYSATGASHILAVSGLHVGVLFFVLNFLLGLILGENRLPILKMFILILFLWVYAFITGLSPSVIRASVMFSFVCAGVVLQRKSLIYNTVASSAFLMLLYNPFYLFDISFQLSYVAVLSIVFFQGRIYGLLSLSSWLLDKAWSLFTVSVAAQLGTFPLVLYYFHQFPNYFWLSGFVVVPASAVIIYSAISLLAFSKVPFLGDCIAFALKWILKTMNFFVRLIEELPYAVFENIRFEFYDLGLIYLSLLFFVFYIVSKNGRYLFVQMSIIALLLSVNTIIKYRQLTTSVFAVYNIQGVSAINKLERGRNVLFFEGDFQNIRKKINNFWIRNGAANFERISHPFFLVGGKKVMILIDDSYKDRKAEQPLSVDFLVVSNNAPYSVAELAGLFQFQTVIFDSSNSNYKLKRWKEQCEQLNVTYHIVKEQGAYCVAFN